MLVKVQLQPIGPEQWPGILARAATVAANNNKVEVGTMPFSNQPTDPRRNLPPGESFVAVARALTPYARKSTYAREALGEVQRGHEQWKKGLRHVFDHEYLAEVGDPSPLVDLPVIERSLRASDTILAKMLAKNGKAAEVDQALSRTKGVSVGQITQMLLEVAKAVDVNSVRVFAKEVNGELETLAVAQRRVAEGGHAAFDQQVAALARKLWIVLDTGYDALCICLRKACISYDPTYAARPTVKTPLRQTVSTTAPGAVRAKRKAGAGKSRRASKGKGVSAPAAPSASPEGTASPQTAAVQVGLTKARVG